VAIRSIKGNVDRAKARAKKAYDEGFLDGKEVGKPGVEMILNSSRKAQAKRRKTKDKLAKKKQELNKPASAKGGGKIYTSMDKKYGGGIFPKKGNI